MSYPYNGLELTPTIFKELLITLFDGKQFDRAIAVGAITKYHLENGGKLGKSSYIQTFKRACLYLKKNGLVNVGYGVWRLNYEKTEIEVISSPQQKEEITYPVDKELGSGKKSVYVYYYDGYRNLAELNKKGVWECKVGRTDVDPIVRVIGQAGTCYPELPHVALIIYCDDSSLLEKTLHDILKLRGKWLSESPGREWFLTSPEEIEEIYKSIMKC